MLFRLSFLILAVSCASNNPTPYQKQKKKQLGYNDRKTEDMRIVTFRGNSYTSKDRALRYAEFRAIEVCQRQDKKHANIMDTVDKTVEKEITRSTGTGWGPSYFGMYPYYSRYSSFGVGAGFNTISTNSWNETLTFPVIDVYFTCANRIFRPNLLFQELSGEKVKHLVKDVKGAIQVEKILEDSPNKSDIETGDIILKARGKRIEKVFELINHFGENGQSVEAEILRDGERRKILLKSKDVTDEVIKAEEKITKRVCDDKNKKKQRKLKTSKLCH